MQQYLRLFTTTPQHSQSYIAANNFCIVCFVISAIIVIGSGLAYYYCKKHHTLDKEATSFVWEIIDIFLVIFGTIALIGYFITASGIKPIKAASQQQAVQAINAAHREYPYLMHVSCTYNDYGIYGGTSTTSKYYLLKKKPQNTTAKVYRLKVTDKDNHTTAQLKYAGQRNLGVDRNITIRDSHKYLTKKVLKHTHWLDNVYHQ